MPPEERYTGLRLPAFGAVRAAQAAPAPTGNPVRRVFGNPGKVLDAQPPGGYGRPTYSGSLGVPTVPVRKPKPLTPEQEAAANVAWRYGF